MISRPKGSVQVRCAPSPEVNVPALVVKPSVAHAERSPTHLIATSISRNSRPMPSDTMIDGTIRLATAV